MELHLVQKISVKRYSQPLKISSLKKERQVLEPSGKSTLETAAQSEISKKMHSDRRNKIQTQKFTSKTSTNGGACSKTPDFNLI
jgi:hypothetical protein